MYDLRKAAESTPNRASENQVSFHESFSKVSCQGQKTVEVDDTNFQGHFCYITGMHACLHYLSSDRVNYAIFCSSFEIGNLDLNIDLSMPLSSAEAP